jgi:hypothetical protein
VLGIQVDVASRPPWQPPTSPSRPELIERLRPIHPAGRPVRTSGARVTDRPMHLAHDARRFRHLAGVAVVGGRGARPWRSCALVPTALFGDHNNRAGRRAARPHRAACVGPPGRCPLPTPPVDHGQSAGRAWGNPCPSRAGLVRIASTSGTPRWDVDLAGRSAELGGVPEP